MRKGAKEKQLCLHHVTQGWCCLIPALARWMVDEIIKSKKIPQPGQYQGVRNNGPQLIHQRVLPPRIIGCLYFGIGSWAASQLKFTQQCREAGGCPQ